VAEPLLLTTRDELLAALPRFAAAPRLALDCESNGMHAWRGRLCLLQLAIAYDDVPSDAVALVDTLALVDLAPLVELLGPAGPVKILHDSGFDARLLRDAGITLGNVVDTSVMARFLGCRETGLGSLLGQRFGVALDKSLQQHDWARRPLGAREVAYLAGDVVDLGRLAAALEAEVRAKDIVDEVAEESAYALRCALADEGTMGYWRVKGVRELGAIGRAVARALWHVRERVAEAKDVPPGRVLSNASLVQLAKSRPRSAADVRASGLLGAASGGGIAEAVVEAVMAGVAAGDIPADEQRWFVSERVPGDLALRRVRETVLQHWRAEEAVRRGVDLQVVLPGHCLADLAASGARTKADLARIEGFGASRLARYGATLVEKINSVA
jgi:ribonuclease D